MNRRDRSFDCVDKEMVRKLALYLAISYKRAEQLLRELKR